MPSFSVATRQLSSSSIAALVLVALIAVFQTSVVFYNVGAQRDSAHIIDISGVQRSRAQRLAYLALSLSTQYPEPGARAEIDETIRALNRTRMELRREPKYTTGPRDANGRTEIGKLADRFIASVRNVERHPHDRAAIREMQRLRPLAFDAFNRAVEIRVGIVARENSLILAALLAGILLQIATIVGVWFGIIAPSETKNRTLLADVQQAREQIESTFAENPDAIAIYDASGYLVRENASREALFGARPVKMAKQHISACVDPSGAQTVRTLFAEALAGKIGRGEYQVIANDRSLIDVTATFFPYLVNGLAAGVTVVAKDIRKLRALEESNAEQARRLNDLYQIASAGGRTTEELLRAAIALLTERLNYEYGVITEIVDETVNVVSTAGNVPSIPVDRAGTLLESLARLALEFDDTFEDRNFFTSAYADIAFALDWHCVAGMKIFADGILYGTVGFASTAPRAQDLSAADVGFMRLACALIGTIIERGRQLKKLDALAFFDVLTGLPNRAQFNARIDELIASKRRFALYYIDLDRFKKINDRYGHSAGDAVLKIAAKRLLSCARAEDMVVRLGGDEFAILQTTTSGRAESGQLAKRVVAAFEEPIDLGGIQVEVGASVGIAVRPRNAVEARALIEAADAALYSAKRGGRGQFAHAPRPDEPWAAESPVPSIEATS